MQSVTRVLDSLRSSAIRLRTTWSDERGASATEYAVIVAIVVGALVLIGAAFGDTLQALWQNMIDGMAGFLN
jgi:Flp pilus assembly pilin Flp